MNKDEFLIEAENYIDNTYKEFYEYQSVTWDILSYVNRLCRENELTYYLAYGTLLGAIRDRGAIPWDYDADIHIKISDRNRLLQILKTKLSKDYYYVYTDMMPNYPAECLRICKKGYTYMSIHVDVFFLVGCPETKDKRVPLLKLARKWSNFRVRKYASQHTNDNLGFSKIKSILLSLYRLQYKIIPEKYILHSEKKIFNYCDISKSSYLMSYCFDVNWGEKEFEVYPSRIFEQSIDIEIDGELFLIPSGYDEYLSILFKDYTSYFPIKNRFDEFYNQVHQIKERQEYYIQNFYNK